MLKDKKIKEHPLKKEKYRIIHHNTPGVHTLKEYNFNSNPENIEIVHLCAWDKLGRDYRTVIRKLLGAMREKYHG